MDSTGGKTMKIRNRSQEILFGLALQRKYFLNLFKSKKGGKVRPGALSPEELKNLINKIGEKKKVNIRRVDFEGNPEPETVSVKIVDIREEYFTGIIINLERSIKQDLNNRLVYVKGGGGTVDFYYADGDIMSVEEDIDEVILVEKDPDELLQILDALDLNESILISYYDQEKGGVINGAGTLAAKNIPAKTFKVELSLINDIELDQPKVINLSLEKNKILDLEVVI